jgi:hypothetical protein
VSTWASSWASSWALSWGGAAVAPAAPDKGGSHGYDISDPRHPYWRIRDELDEQQAAEPALEERAQQRLPADDQAAPATANPAPKAPGAEVVKALLGVPNLDVGEKSPTPPQAAVKESLTAPPKRRTPDVDEDVLLLLLID